MAMRHLGLRGRPPGILYPDYLRLVREAIGPGASAWVFAAGFYYGAAAALDVIGSPKSAKARWSAFRRAVDEVLLLQRMYERVIAALAGEPEEGPPLEGYAGKITGHLMQFREEMKGGGRNGDERLTGDSGFVAGASIALRKLQDALLARDAAASRRTFRAVEEEVGAMLEQLARTGIPRMEPAG